jgi:hypothetical protein
MHINDVEAYKRQKDELMRNEGTHPVNYNYEDQSVLSRQQEENRGFAEHDGSYGGHHLAMKIKEPNKDENMPSIKEAYGSMNSKVRST